MIGGNNRLKNEGTENLPTSLMAAILFEFERSTPVFH